MSKYTIEHTLELKLSKSGVIQNLKNLKSILPKFERTILLTLSNPYEEITKLIIHLEDPKKEFFFYKKNEEKLFQSLRTQLITQEIKHLKIEVCKRKI